MWLGRWLGGKAYGPEIIRPLPKVPTPAAQPLKIVYVLRDRPEACLIVLESDWRALENEIRGVCIDLGWSNEQCQ